MTVSNSDLPNSDLSHSDLSHSELSQVQSDPASSAPDFPPSVYAASQAQAPKGRASFSMPEIEMELYDLMTVEQVQKTLNRSRASVYRYANTDPVDLDPPIDPKRLNPEPRKNREDPLLFAASEVERFAKDILGIRGITLEVQESSESVTQKTLEAILKELQAIRTLLEQRPSP